jgi:hypothetical protein
MVEVIEEPVVDVVVVVLELDGSMVIIFILYASIRASSLIP